MFRPSYHLNQLAGDVVSLYGTIGPQNSDYTARLDDWPAKTVFANRLTWAPQVLLFHADNLGPGNHTLTIINQDDDKLLDIDYALVERLEIATQWVFFSPFYSAPL